MRENCFKLFIISKNPDNFFETIINTYSIQEFKCIQYRDQLDFSIVEFDTRSQKYKLLNQKYKLMYYSSKRNKWSLEDYDAYNSDFFTGEEYNKLTIFLEQMSDQTIEITPYKIAF